MPKKLTAKEMIEALEKQGITCYQISKNTVISEQTLHYWKTGKTKKPNRLMLVLLEDFYKNNIK